MEETAYRSYPAEFSFGVIVIDYSTFMFLKIFYIMETVITYRTSPYIVNTVPKDIVRQSITFNDQSFLIPLSVLSNTWSKTNILNNLDNVMVPTRIDEIWLPCLARYIWQLKIILRKACVWINLNFFSIFKCK